MTVFLNVLVVGHQLTNEIMKILVVCTGNSCRSQMADAFFNKFEDVEAKSAGTNPEGVNPLAAAVMGELGIDISNNGSNHVDEYIDESFDFIITACDNAEKNCPVFQGAGKKIHYEFEDPARAIGSNEERIVKFREVRDQIKSYVNDFVRDSLN